MEEQCLNKKSQEGILVNYKMENSFHGRNISPLNFNDNFGFGLGGFY